MKNWLGSIMLLFASVCVAESSFLNQFPSTNREWAQELAPDLSEAQIEKALEKAKKERPLVDPFKILSTSVEAAVRSESWKTQFDGQEAEFRPDLLGDPKRKERWVNPFTTICWKCIFPIHVMGGKTSPFSPEDKDFANYELKCGCACKEGNQIGIPIAFWEPMMLIEVTPTPYRFPLLGSSAFTSSSYANRGTISNSDSGRTSFYNVHYIPFPLFRILQFVPGFTCMKKLDPVHKFFWCTEWDPLWKNPTWAVALSPQMLLHHNQQAALECIEDCKASNARSPRDDLHWCAGCLGSYYPWVGHVAHHIGHTQASSLLVHRALARLHSIGMMKGFKPNEYCKKNAIFQSKEEFL